MALVLKVIYANVAKFDEKYRDVRTDSFLLMGSPLKIIALTVLYWLFVKKLGPAFMKNRQPYELKNVLLIYNLLQVLANIYLGILAMMPLIYDPNYADWGCMVDPRDNSPNSQFIINTGHLYYLLKVVDYLDTVFFVLRKRNNQITFLHVYHHILMATACYLTVRYLGGGQPVLLATINLWVHAIMYFYYFMSALRPAMKNSLWWKKYITQVQIAQFLILIVHFARPLLLSRDCSESKPIMFFCLLQNLFMALMFLDFYRKAYLRKPKVKVDKKND